MERRQTYSRKLDIGHQLAPNPMKLPSSADEKESGRLGIQAFRYCFRKMLILWYCILKSALQKQPIYSVSPVPRKETEGPDQCISRPVPSSFPFHFPNPR
jgi:hypothetical protein